MPIYWVCMHYISFETNIAASYSVLLTNFWALFQIYPFKFDILTYMLLVLHPKNTTKYPSRPTKINHDFHKFH